MVLIVPRRPHFELPSDPLAILREAPFIRFDRETWTGLLVKDVLSQCSVHVRDGMELNSVEAILAIVRQGFGVAIVPKLANAHWSATARCASSTCPASTFSAMSGCSSARGMRGCVSPRRSRNTLPIRQAAIALQPGRARASEPASTSRGARRGARCVMPANRRRYLGIVARALSRKL